MVRVVQAVNLTLCLDSAMKIDEDLTVPDHDGGRPKEINAWFLYTHMVYL